MHNHFLMLGHLFVAQETFSQCEKEVNFLQIMYDWDKHCTTDSSPPPQYQSSVLQWEIADAKSWLQSLTCSKIDGYITQKDRVRNAVENDPVQAEVIIEEGNGHR